MFDLIRALDKKFYHKLSDRWCLLLWNEQK